MFFQMGCFWWIHWVPSSLQNVLLSVPTAEETMDMPHSSLHFKQEWFNHIDLAAGFSLK